MTALYLAFNAVMYAVFAVWCALAPTKTAEYVGLAAISDGGRSEYVAVYGGLQAGLSLFFALALWNEAHRASALWMSALLYGGIALFRTFVVARLGFSQLGNARAFYCAEVVLFLLAVALLAGRARA